MELEPSSNFKADIDRRPGMTQPLSVKLVCVEDVSIEAAAGLEPELDGFYVDLLGFEREQPEGPPIYRADNARLRVLILEGPVRRSDYRPVGIMVKSVAALETGLVLREINYVRQKSTQPGIESLLLNDPAGNWVEISQYTEVR